MPSVIYHPAYRTYSFADDHPFSPLRTDMMLDLLEALGRRVETVEPEPASREEILGVARATEHGILTVRDEGPGIPHEVRARVFEPALLPGRPRTETFVLLSNNVTGFVSDLPVLILHSLGKGAPSASRQNFAHFTSQTAGPCCVSLMRYRCHCCLRKTGE